jgi:hypothetical protein
MDPRLLLLAPEDNVLVARRRIPAGAVLELEDAVVTLTTDLPIGHKLARRAIAAGESVRKYAAPIGIATADIPAGAHVHVHNIRSDYTPTYTLDAARQATGEATP